MECKSYLESLIFCTYLLHNTNIDIGGEVLSVPLAILAKN